jgi:hypothetical protein
VVAAVAEDTALSGSRDEDNTETPEKPEPVAEAIETAVAVENKADEAVTERVEEQGALIYLLVDDGVLLGSTEQSPRSSSSL